MMRGPRSCCSADEDEKPETAVFLHRTARPSPRVRRSTMPAQKAPRRAGATLDGHPRLTPHRPVARPRRTGRRFLDRFGFGFRFGASAPSGEGGTRGSGAACRCRGNCRASRLPTATPPWPTASAHPGRPPGLGADGGLPGEGRPVVHRPRSGGAAASMAAGPRPDSLTAGAATFSSTYRWRAPGAGDQHHVIAPVPQPGHDGPAGGDVLRRSCDSRSARRDEADCTARRYPPDPRLLCTDRSGSPARAPSLGPAGRGRYQPPARLAPAHCREGCGRSSGPGRGRDRDRKVRR